MREAVQSGGEMVNGVVGHGHGTVAAFVVNFEAEIGDVFFADLNVVRDALAGSHLAPAAFVETEVGVNQIAVIFDEPIDAVVRAAAFFIGGDGDNDVAVGLEAFAFVADEIRHPDGGLGFVVGCAAAVEVAVAFGKDERIEAPVFPFGFDDVAMGEQKESVCGRPCRDSEQPDWPCAGRRRR